MDVRSAVNRMVIGSNPILPAKICSYRIMAYYCGFVTRKSLFDSVWEHQSLPENLTGSRVGWIKFRMVLNDQSVIALE